MRKNSVAWVCLLAELFCLNSLALGRGKKDPNRRLGNGRIISGPDKLRSIALSKNPNADPNAQDAGSKDESSTADFFEKDSLFLSTGKSGSGSKGGKGSGSSLGSGAGSSGLAGGGTSQINENQKQVNPLGETGEGDIEGKKNEVQGPPPRVSPPAESKLTKFWMPLCFFMDPVYSEEEGRATIKEVVDAFGDCDIAVEVHATTLRLGTYNQDNPQALNDNAAAHCNVKEYYGVSTVKGAAQTHPNSQEASDRMCDKEPIIKLKEAGQIDWNVGGCATMPGTESIVDYGGGGPVAAHELGHNVGNFDQGGSTLENENEHGQKRTSAGYGLQLTATAGTEAIEGGVEASGQLERGFTKRGCQSLQGGANDNTEKKLRWFRNANGYYYKENDVARQLDYNGREKLFLPPTGETPPVGGKEPPPTPPRKEQDIVQGEKPGSGDMAQRQPPSGEAPQARDKIIANNDVGHKIPKTSNPGSPPPMSQGSFSGPEDNQVVKIRPDEPQKELVGVPPSQGNPGSNLSYGFDENRRSESPNAEPQFSTATGGSTTFYDEGAKGGGISKSIATKDGIEDGKPNGADKADREPASSLIAGFGTEVSLRDSGIAEARSEMNSRRKKIKKVKDWRRNSESTLRAGKTGSEIYQTGSVSFE